MLYITYTRLWNITRDSERKKDKLVPSGNITNQFHATFISCRPSWSLSTLLYVCIIRSRI